MIPLEFNIDVNVKNGNTQKTGIKLRQNDINAYRLNFTLYKDDVEMDLTDVLSATVTFKRSDGTPVADVNNENNLIIIGQHYVNGELTPETPDLTTGKITYKVKGGEIAKKGTLLCTIELYDGVGENAIKITSSTVEMEVLESFDGVNNGIDNGSPLLNILLTEIDSKVSLTGDETIDGVKTYSSSPIVPTPTTDMQTSNKKYVDDGLFNIADKSITTITTTEMTIGLALNLSTNNIWNIIYEGLVLTPMGSLNLFIYSPDGTVTYEDSDTYLATLGNETQFTLYISVQKIDTKTIEIVTKLKYSYYPNYPWQEKRALLELDTEITSYEFGIYADDNENTGAFDIGAIIRKFKGAL